MRHLTTLCFFLTVSLFLWVSCKRPGDPQPAKASVRLLEVAEHYGVDSSSVRIRYSYTADGRLTKEDFYQRNAPWFSKTYSYAPGSSGNNGTTALRTYDLDGNLISQKEYSSGTIIKEDANTYQNGRLVRSESRTYQFQIYQFSFPIQLTKSYYSYNAQYQLINRIDSVFNTYEYLPGTLVFRPITGPFTYVGLHTTLYQYNEKGDVSLQTYTQSEGSLSPMFYQNGVSLLIYGAYLPGTIAYAYSYRPDGQVKRKTAVFNDGKTSVNHTSTFDYTYSAE